MQIKRPKKYFYLLFLSMPACILDQLTKQLILHSIPHGDTIPVINNFFNLTYVQNTGAAFSLLAGMNVFFFLAISLVAVGLIFFFFAKVDEQQTYLTIALALILGGAIGNIWDRLVYGYVIDFLDIQIVGRHWPSFNVADIAITIGVVFLILDMFTSRQNSQISSSGDAVTGMK